jgi:hypothetical protein
LVEPYQVAPSIDLEENLNFHIFDNVYIEELNVILSSSGQAQVDEDDDSNDIIDINVEDCNGADDELIEEEEGNSN